MFTVNAYKNFAGMIVRLCKDAEGTFWVQLEGWDGNLLPGYEKAYMAPMEATRAETLKEVYRLFGAPMLTIL